MSVVSNRTSRIPDHDDEIDLKDLFIKAMGAIKRRIALLIIFSLLGLIIGYSIFKLKKPIFSSSMTISSTILTAANTTTIIETLQSLVDEGNHELLSQRLAMSLEQVIQIKQISVDFERDVDASEDYYIYDIQVSVTNNQILDTLQNHLIYFLETNPFVKKRVDLKKENLHSMILKLRNEITEIDSLKDVVGVFATQSRSNVVIMDPVNIYKEGVNLYQKELELRAELLLVDNFQIIEGFTAFNVPSSPTPMMIYFGLLIGFFLGLFLIFILEIIKFFKVE